MEHLTNDSVSKINSSTLILENFRPNVQVLNIRKVVSNDNETEIRFQISDGIHKMNATLSNKMFDLIHKGVFIENAIINVQDYECLSSHDGQNCYIKNCVIRFHANGQQLI